MAMRMTYATYPMVATYRCTYTLGEMRKAPRSRPRIIRRRHRSARCFFETYVIKVLETMSSDSMYEEWSEALTVVLISSYLESL